MSDSTPIPLLATPIDLDGPEFAIILNWPFADSFVGRLLRDDIPRRVRFSDARVWVYRDPEERLVGFGTLDICEDYRSQTGGVTHPYIPLLAVNPTIRSLGYGTSIMRHLIGEAALLASLGHCHDVLFLDVYETSTKAIDLYRKCDFLELTETPIPDPLEGNKGYLIMARSLALARP